MIEKYPMKLKPVLKDIIWGGTRLAAEFGKSNNSNNFNNSNNPNQKIQKIAESWELAVRKNGVNIIENGKYAGQTLEDLFKLDKSIVSQNYSGGKFPLLIKFIDAAQDLSVQVHPYNDYAEKSGKTEMWYIIDCEPGAKLVYGLNDNYTREQLQNLIECGRFEECLNYVEVKPGDVYFIPAGLVHAIGAGILIAEIQQNSDTTYRFYDYNRLGADGKPRELHIQQALDVCIKTKNNHISSTDEISKPISIVWKTLIECEYFTVVRITPVSSIYFTIESDFFSIICLDGDGEIIWDDILYKIKKGDSYFLPAGTGRCEIKNTSGNFTFLLTTLNKIL